ncbi:amino acid ABC transporter substrate-binding protein [Halobellus clavatus]|nr:amino acid ABC transporter substrate-binding protein [Halobellus clavatus]
MPTSNRRRFITAAGTGAVALVTGCLGADGDGDSTATPTSDSGTDATTTTMGSSGSDEPITVAATVSRTGSFSSAGEDVETAYRLGEQLINDDGGILGRDVNVIIRDDESDPQQVRESLQTIIENNDVDMIWGTFGSLLVGAAASVAEREGLPMLSANFAYMEPHLNNNYEWTFAPFGKSRDMANGAVKLANLAPEDNKPVNVGIWQTNTGWGAELGRVWSDALEANGHEVVLNEKFQIGSSDFSTLISQAKSANVEYLLTNPSPGGGITMVNQMQENEFNPKLATIERAATITAWLDATGVSGLYTNSTPGWVPGLTGGGNQQMLEAFRAQDDVASDAYPAPTVGGSYNVTQTAKQAFETAGSVEPDAVRDALLNSEFQTVLGSFRFDENGMPVEGDLAPPMGQWQDGQLRLVIPSDVDSEASTDIEYPAPAYDQRSM